MADNRRPQTPQAPSRPGTSSVVDVPKAGAREGEVPAPPAGAYVRYNGRLPVVVLGGYGNLLQGESRFVDQLTAGAFRDPLCAEEGWEVSDTPFEGGGELPGGGTGGDALPVLTELSPNTAVIGIPSFTLHVLGTGFKAGDTIFFNNYQEPTTFVSETEVTTGVNMDTWSAPSNPLPVCVQNAAGQRSNELMFTFLAAR